MNASRSVQKITMLIEVFPRPRLDVVGKDHEPNLGDIDVRGSVDDEVVNETLNNAGSKIKILRPCFAFDIATEDLFLLDSQQSESLLSGALQEISVSFFYGDSDNRRNYHDAQNRKDETEVRLRFFSVLKKAHLVQDGVWNKEGRYINDKERNNILDRYFQKLKKCCKRLHW